MLLWAVAATLAAAPPAEAAERLLGLVGGEATVARGALGRCRPADDEPGALDCEVGGLAPATAVRLLCDGRQRVQSIAPRFPRQPSAEAAAQAVRPLLGLLTRRWGAPQMKATEAGREWILSRREVVALVRIAERGGAWEVQALITDPRGHHMGQGP